MLKGIAIAYEKEKRKAERFHTRLTTCASSVYNCVQRAKSQFESIKEEKNDEEIEYFDGQLNDICSIFQLALHDINTLKAELGRLKRNMRE